MACQRGLALITGGCGGLGMAFARSWLQRGGSVRLADMVSQKKGDEACQQLGNNVEFVSCDVTDKEALREAFSNAEDLSLVINNAGIVAHDGADLFENWEPMIGINVDGVVNGTRLALEAFERKPIEDGTSRVILNVGSMAGLIPTTVMPVYTATKYAVVGFTRAMHVAASKRYDPSIKKNVPTGIRVHAVCPSFADTGMVNADTLAKDPRNKRTVELFGGLLTPDFVSEAAFEKLVDDPAARAILRVTPVDGVKFDAPGLHPVEKAVRNNAIRADPWGTLRKIMGSKAK